MSPLYYLLVIIIQLGSIAKEFKNTKLCDAIIIELIQIAMAKSRKPPIPYTPASVWATALVLCVIGGLFFLKAYLGVIILSLLLSYIFFPVFDYFRNKFGSQGMAVAITTVITVLFVAIPIVIIFTLTISQAVSLANNFSSSFETVQDKGFENSLEEVVDIVNKQIENVVGIKTAIKDSDVNNFMNNTLPNILRALTNSLIGIVSGIPTFLTNFIIFLFVFPAGLTGGKKMVRTIKAISPFDPGTNKRYIDRVGLMAKAMLKGQLVIATVQGFASAAVLALVGFSEYFWFFAVVLTFMSFIPLGAGIVTIPIGILLALFGNVTGGVIVILNHLIIVTNIDNFIRPKLVPKGAQLSPALTILSAFAGVSYFGFLGVIYGPIIMIIITTTLESYISYKKQRGEAVLKNA